MLEGIEIIKPDDIEKRSFEILSGILGDRKFRKEHEPIVKRVIHTTADFEYADLVNISDDAVESAFNAIRNGCSLVTDTKMALAGINKRNLARYGGQGYCFMDDEDIAAQAKARNVTRASLCMEKASRNPNINIYVIGNAPTALIRLYELIKERVVNPALIVGVPVGFVNVVESKELIKKLKVPYIIT